VKFGLEFFIANGLDACRRLRDVGASRPRQLFLDLKFHDIPNTVAGAVRSALAIEPDYLTVHTCEGVAPLHAALNVVDRYEGKRPKLLGVCVLTSNDVDEHLFMIRATAAGLAGLDGLICPPSFLRHVNHLSKFLMVPGIRMPESERDDQKNVATPFVAMSEGANALVIGRDITRAEDPLKAVLAIKETLDQRSAVAVKLPPTST
jgi:orotidine-5'-phosphate decarboxylase